MQRQIQTVMTALLLLLAICGQAAAGGGPAPNQWNGSGPFATGLGNRVITALAVSPDGTTVYAGSGSGTVFSYAVTPPTATTDAATGVTTSAAVLNGTVNPLNTNGTVRFEYGPTSAYGSQVDAVPHDVSGSADTPVSAAITVTPGATYHFRVVAETTSGTTLGGDQSFTALRLNQAISFGEAPTVVVDGTGTVSANGGASGNPVVFTSKTIGICTVSGTTVTGKAVGTCTIAANQAGNAMYYDAPEATQDISIGKGNQATLVITAPTSTTFGDADATIGTSGGSGSGALTFDAGTSTACSIVAGKLHINSGTGSCAITATKSVDSNYHPATSALFTVDIRKANQATLAITGPTPMTFGDTDATIGTSGGSGSGTVTFNAGSSTACSIVTGKLHILSGTGSCAITASKAEDNDYNQSTSAAFTVNILKANQATLAITGPTAMTYGDADATIATSGGSGSGTVTLNAGSSTACSIVADKLHIISATGSCAITASKAEDNDYKVATSVAFTVTIAKAALTVTADNKSRPYASDNPAFSVTYTGLANGDAPSAITGAPAFITKDSQGNPVTLTPTSRAGSYTIAVTQGTLSSVNYEFISFVNGTFTVTAITPSVSTADIFNITPTGFTAGGVLADDGGADASRGFCWGTAANPTVGGNCMASGSGLGEFTADIGGLAPSTLYHVRAYATNTAGTSYGNDLTVTTAANPPTGLSGTPLYGAIDLSWTQNPDPSVIGYRIHYDPDMFMDVGRVGSYRLTGLANDMPYRIYVSSVNSAGTEGRSPAITVTPLSHFTLELHRTGSGAGMIIHSEEALACNGDCSYEINYGSRVTLTAFPDEYSLFGGWSGSCSGSAVTCAFTMDATPRSATASFTRDDAHAVNIDLPVPGFYSSILAAYQAASGGATIKAWGIDFTENLLFYRGIEVTLGGGYDGAYASNSGTTTVKGSVTVKNGVLTVDNIAVK